MKKLFLFLVLALSSVSTYAQDTSSSSAPCEIMHSGKFMDADDDDPSAYLIIDGSELSEYSNFGKNISKSHIKWNNDCSYTLTLLETNVPDLKEVVGKKMKVDILDVDGDTITYKMILNGASYERELVKVNDENSYIETGQIEVFAEILIF